MTSNDVLRTIASAGGSLQAAQVMKALKARHERVYGWLVALEGEELLRIRAEREFGRDGRELRYWELTDRGQRLIEQEGRP